MLLKSLPWLGTIRRMSSWTITASQTGAGSAGSDVEKRRRPPA